MVGVVVAIVSLARPEFATAQEPDVKITEVPPARAGGPNEMFPIGGTVTGAAPKEHKVVIYVLAGDRWWVQPFDYAPLTEIKSNGKFETETHPGTIYAALVVKASFKAPATLQVLPDVGGTLWRASAWPGSGSRRAWLGSRQSPGSC